MGLFRKYDDDLINEVMKQVLKKARDVDRSVTDTHEQWRNQGRAVEEKHKAGYKDAALSNAEVLGYSREIKDDLLSLAEEFEKAAAILKKHA